MEEVWDPEKEFERMYLEEVLEEATKFPGKKEEPVEVILDDLPKDKLWMRDMVKAMEMPGLKGSEAANAWLRYAQNISAKKDVGVLDIFAKWEPERMFLPMEEKEKDLDQEVTFKGAPKEVQQVYVDDGLFKEVTVDGISAVAVATEEGVHVVSRSVILGWTDHGPEATDFAKTLMAPGAYEKHMSNEHLATIAIATILPQVNKDDDILIDSEYECTQAMNLLAGHVRKIQLQGTQEEAVKIAVEVEMVVCKPAETVSEVYLQLGVPDENDSGGVRQRQVVARVIMSDVMIPDKELYQWRHVRDGQRFYTNFWCSKLGPRGRLGNCVMCRAVESRWPDDFNFDEWQRSVWRDLHYHLGEVACEYFLEEGRRKVVIPPNHNPVPELAAYIRAVSSEYLECPLYYRTWCEGEICKLTEKVLDEGEPVHAAMVRIRGKAGVICWRGRSRDVLFMGEKYDTEFDEWAVYSDMEYVTSGTNRVSLLLFLNHVHKCRRFVPPRRRRRSRNYEDVD